MPGKSIKRIFRLLTILLLLLVSSIAYLLYASLPQESGKIHLPDLTAAASVNTDRFGIPSIQAVNRQDAFRVLGYLHARDRLFQMDLLRRKSQGRLAEILGVKLLNLDKSQRDYQLQNAASRIVASLPTLQRAVLDAYAAGVNSLLNEARILPPEFLALNYRPEPWQAEDCILAAMGMFQMLNGQEQDERMLSVMDQALPASLVQFLTPDTDVYALPLLGGAQSHRPAREIPLADFNSLGEEIAALDLGGVNAEGSVLGSNNWVVSGSKTADGRAMIANDMHIQLNTPNIWYRAELRYTDVQLNGVTLPGLPAMIVGSNQQVAWGFTNATADLLDLIKLDINPQNSQEYLSPQGWKRFEQSQQTIKVKDGEDVKIDLLSTIWGPVSSQPLLGHPVAIKWIALDPEAVNLGLLDMDKVQSVAQALPVLNQAGSPPQNVVLADRDGHIGWTLMGHFPKRKGFDGLISLSWADAAIGWDGYIPDTELPRLVDPTQGFIATANNRTLGSDYPYILGHNWGLGYRAWRISEQLQQAQQITEADMLKLQLDTRSEMFEFYRQLALQAIKLSPDKAAALASLDQTLRAWDQYMRSDSKGTALLINFRGKLAEGVFAKVIARCRQLDPKFNYAWREMETPLRELLTQQPKGVLSSNYHDDWNSFVLHALQASADELSQRFPGIAISELNWGTANRINVQHPFSKSMPMLARLLDIDSFESDGCAGWCIKVLSNINGASERLVVAPGHPEQGILQMPGGQSGHLLSTHYRDQQIFWQTGAAVAFLPGESLHQLSFLP